MEGLEPERIQWFVNTGEIWSMDFQTVRQAKFLIGQGIVVLPKMEEENGTKLERQA